MRNVIRGGTRGASRFFRFPATIAAMMIATMTLTTACTDDGGTPVEPGTLTLSVAAPTATAVRGTSATYAIGVVRGGSFTAAVTLTTEGVPAGITATLSPSSVPAGTAAASLTLDVGAATAPGLHTITIRAHGTGVIDYTTQVTLVVPAPAVAVALGNPASTMVQGSSITVPVTITRNNGFTGAVDLAQQGLIVGVTVSFSPATIATGSTTSTMTVAAAFGSSLGTSPVTIVASGTGVATVTTQLQLTINPGEPLGFTLTTTPASFNVVAGGSVTSSIALTRQGGFSALVALAVTGAPSGVTTSFSVNPLSADASTLTIATTAAVSPGTYQLVVRASATGLLDRTSTITLIVAIPPGFTLTVTPTSLSVPQSRSAQATVVATRVGGFTGDITMSLENAPTGVTALFAPNPATGTNAVMTLSVATTTGTGNYTVTIRGRGAGNTTATTTLALAVTPATYTLAVVPGTMSIAQGQTRTGNVNITRDAGFDGAVSLRFATLPSGVEGLLTPAFVTGAQTLFSLAVHAATAPGNYTVTVIGSAPGLTDQVVTFTLEITPGSAGGGPIAWKFCDVSRVPLWFGFRDGATGAWTRVNGDAENVFTVPITFAVGNVAFVYEEGVVTKTDVFQATASELRDLAAAECTAHPLAGKTIMGNYGGVSGTDQMTVSMGGVTAFTSAAAPMFTLNNVQGGVQDLLATRLETIVAGPTVTRTPSRMLMRRNVDVPNNSTLAVLDFTSMEGFVPANTEFTFANALGEIVTLAGSFFTGTSAPMSMFTDPGSASVTRTYFGVPGSLLLSGDLQSALAAATNPNGVRTVQSWFRTVDSRTLTFGPDLANPTISSSTTGGSIRPRARGTIQAEYGAAFTALFTQGSNRSVTITATRGYFGSAGEYDLDTPELVSASGFSSDWTLLAGSPTSVVISATGASTGTFGVITNGTTLRTGARVLTRTF